MATQLPIELTDGRVSGEERYSSISEMLEDRAVFDADISLNLGINSKWNFFYKYGKIGGCFPLKGSPLSSNISYRITT